MAVPAPVDPAASPRRALPPWLTWPVRGWRLNLLLFLLTAGSTWLVGGVAYAAALLAILTAHEMGHYLTARHFKVAASLPYFIPVPLAIGTFGAVIKMDDRVPDRRALVLIGAAGPLAGMALALPLLVWGLEQSVVAPALASPGITDFGLLGMLSGDGLAGGPYPIIVEGESALYWLMQRLVLDVPPGSDVWIHPVAFAAWIGLFVTALNLLPVGQLDGGHVLYGLMGERAHHLGDVTRGILLGLGLMTWTGWLLWVVLVSFSLRLTGGRHPPVLQPEAPLSRGVRAVGWASLLLLPLTFSPVPLAPVGVSFEALRGLPAEARAAQGLCDARIDWLEAAEAGGDPGPAPGCPGD